MRVLKDVGFILAALILTLLPQGVWSALLGANLRTGIAIPWAAPTALVLLWLGWRFAGGQPPFPRSETRQAYRRAHPVGAPTMVWALLANGFSIVALAALWILLRHLVKTPGNPSPDLSSYPVLPLTITLGAAGIIGAVSEEVGLRGYILGRLEQRMAWPWAVVVMALVVSPGHALTQGFVWPTMLFYLLSDVTYGVTARLAGSIVPGIIAHAVGLFVFFDLIWPHDHERVVVPLAQADQGIWALAATVVAGAALTVWAFTRLARQPPAKA